jgi:hypothetical protein
MERGVLVLWLLLAGAASWAEIAVELAPGEVIVLQRLHGVDAIRIDGHLDEPVWQTLPAYDEFVVIEPDTLGETVHDTYIRLAYDERGLYVGAEMRQPAETLITRLSSRDERGLNRDSINLTLDTSGAGRYGYWFGINLGDSLMDGTVLPERQFSNDWDGPWQGRSQQTPTGWTAEFFIPWSTLSMPTVGELRRMGLYMSRKVAYLDERWGWPALPDTVPKFMSALQPLEMVGVAPRQQYNFYPFLAASYDGIDDEMQYRAGADVFWRPSSNFQLNATLNPDFGNVESDDVVINLTATETFFPEKRLFFLEGQDLFVATPRADTRGGGVGNTGAPYSMVYTRRIGGVPRFAETPPGVTIPKRSRFRPVELHGAAKVTGQTGGLRYGLLGAFEDDIRFDAQDGQQPRRLYQDGSDYGVARLLYEDGSTGAYRALGFLSTAVLNPQRDALAQGVDGHYLSADGRWKFDGQLMTSDIDRIGRGYGGFVDLEYTFRRGMQQRFGIEYFDETFDINDLGFLERNDHYRVRSAFVLTRSDLGWARNYQLDVRGFLQKNLSESLFNGGGVFVTNRVTMHNLSRLTSRLHFMPRQYDDLNSFGNGTYRVDERAEALLFWDSDTSQPLSVNLGGGYWQERVGGSTVMSRAGVSWRPDDRFSLNFDVEYLDRDGWLLHQADDLFATFQAHQWKPRLSMDYFLGPRQQLRLAFQWVGIKAREDTFLRVPACPGDLFPSINPPAPVSGRAMTSQCPSTVSRRVTAGKSRRCRTSSWSIPARRTSVPRWTTTASAKSSATPGISRCRTSWSSRSAIAWGPDRDPWETCGRPVGGPVGGPVGDLWEAFGRPVGAACSRDLRASRSQIAPTACELFPWERFSIAIINRSNWLGPHAAPERSRLKNSRRVLGPWVV